jgi:heme/copper-type cytochrome/quinol oxidase subunit 4
MKMEQRVCSETMASKLQTPANHPEESIQRSEHSEKFEIKKYLVSYLLSSIYHVLGFGTNVM